MLADVRLHGEDRVVTESLAEPNEYVGPHDDEPHSSSLSGRLNWLRAGVLGANDGIVSTAGIVFGVAGATPSGSAIAVAGVAGLVAGAMSMAAGEYVSVSTQRDSERALLDKERRELVEEPEEELAELADLYMAKGSEPTSLRWTSLANSRPTTPSARTPRSSWGSIPTTSPTPGTRPGRR